MVDVTWMFSAFTSPGLPRDRRSACITVPVETGMKVRFITRATSLSIYQSKPKLKSLRIVICIFHTRFQCPKKEIGEI